MFSSNQMDLDLILADMFNYILTQMKEFQECGSGWAFMGINHLLMCSNKYSPLTGSGYIPLPGSIRTKAKGAILNIKTQDRRCFVYCIVAGLLNIFSEDVNDFPENLHEFVNLKNITMPVQLNEIKLFEKQNPTISVNVFGFSNGEIVGPLYHTKQEKQNHFFQLFLQNG